MGTFDIFISPDEPVYVISVVSKEWFKSGSVDGDQFIGLGI